MRGNAMPAGFTILIADRNRHVRNFLRRELLKEGYRVEVATDAPDLLILDLEIPYVGGLTILKRLTHRYPHLPVIIHTFPSEDANDPVVQSAAAFVEKIGNTDRLKRIIQRVLREYYPRRSGGGKGSEDKECFERRLIE
jgi:DNA-binding NtrC family response regulator